MKKFTPTLEQQAVLGFSDSMVITACPGSGKTAVIAEKVRQILPSIPVYRGIIAISYTRKASAELKRRCEFDGVDTKKSFFGTIDSFSISEVVIPFFRHLCGENPAKIEIKYFASLSDEQKKLFDGVSLNSLVTKDIDTIKTRLETLYGQGVILMETVGVLAVHVIKNSLACKRYLKSRFSGVFIDEYQDSGEPQHELFIQFKSLNITSVAVGDVNQSIFGFSNRDPIYLESLCAQNSGYRHFELTINHRCHPSIVNYADRLLDENFPLQPVDGIRVFRCQINGTQAEICTWINSVLEQVKANFNVEHNREIGILVRNSNTGKMVANNLAFPSRFFNDNILSQSTSLCSTIFSALLGFRFNICLTAQSIIDEFAVAKMNRGNIAGMRRVVIHCRKCDEVDFVKSAVLAAKMLSGADVPASSLAELQAVIANPNDMKFFDPISENEVQILTLHKAKGLEFKVVFHLDLYDWILPRRVFIQGNYDVIFENQQECLNLHYVGITRSQEACILLTSTQRYNFNNQIKAAKPSQFFDKPGLVGLYQ